MSSGSSMLAITCKRYDVLSRTHRTGSGLNF
jgi:hypothetical protein